MSKNRGRTGTSTIETSKSYRVARSKRKKRQEDNWSRRSGDVVTRLVGEEKVKPPEPTKTHARFQRL